ncbi:hypothetical protein NPIL_172901 [Nephila pilipes]|uniref:Uncharacterized protein n=1 Tax=Nephila pilipes TaxID=299642 RepID=A0A8X6TPD5_NEPPI|nr:hypothetical protein NPIL_172901 [Nephila pilipes]
MLNNHTGKFLLCHWHRIRYTFPFENFVVWLILVAKAKAARGWWQAFMVDAERFETPELLFSQLPRQAGFSAIRPNVRQHQIPPPVRCPASSNGKPIAVFAAAERCGGPFYSFSFSGAVRLG